MNTGVLPIPSIDKCSFDVGCILSDLIKSFVMNVRSLPTSNMTGTHLLLLLRYRLSGFVSTVTYLGGANVCLYLWRRMFSFLVLQKAELWESFLQ
ncbi:unnamed protein product [Anisakis simplex]|uniref:Uncharacterized protein n=1 Tax=Anisakis simplex TaxID=6269 RepID=A0A3P6QWV7_ANISI|nr:unnamed protein product [Anisakis simplex]